MEAFRLRITQHGAVYLFEILALFLDAPVIGGRHVQGMDQFLPVIRRLMPMDEPGSWVSHTWDRQRFFQFCRTAA